MRILTISTSFPAHEDDVAGVFVLRLLRALKQYFDIDSTVITPDATNVRSNWPSDINIIRFRYAPRKFQVLAQHPGGIPQALKRNPMLWFLVPLFLGSMARSIKKYGRDHDVIHAHWAITGFIAGLLKKQMGKPIIVTLHGTDVNRAMTNRAFHYVLKRVCKDASGIACVSEHIYRKIKRHFTKDKNKVFFVPNGVDDIFFSRVIKEKIQPPIIFSYIGTLIPSKGVDILIKAFARLKNMKNWHLIVVGDGPQKGYLRDLCQKMELVNKVEFSGMMPPQKIPYLMEKANCLILPSYSEGRPSVVLEAMAAGLPVVGSNIEGTRELVKEGENGWLFEAGDERGLTEILRRILNNAQILPLMGKRARGFMLKNGLTWQATAEKYVNIYRSLV